MASNYKKKFKTTETTKAGGAEVVSDPIELSPRTKNHILTVTTDNSLSGTVDVEMEMSPDGQNWCPAVSRTVSSEAASQTGDVIGNEESVKLTPDAGEFKNKHARGGLNFDVSGAVVTPDGSGARDLMHQHIATTKSFNYSQWFKTSEAPTTTYKPVLFRHGGYDNFSNAKTVELTDIAEGSLYGLQSSTAADQSTDFNLNTSGQSTTEKSLFPSLGAGANYMPSVDDDLAVAFWLKSSYTVGTGGRNCIFYQSSATGPSSNFIACYVYRVSSNLNIEFFYGKAGTALKGRTYSITYVEDEWNHIVINKNTGVPSSSNVSFHINGGNAAGGNGISVGSMATTDFDTTTVNDLEFFTYPRWLGSNYNRTECTPIIDEFYAIPRLLTQAEIGEFRTSFGTAEAPSNLSFISVVDSYFRFGDLSNDDVSTNKSYDGKDSNRYIQKNGSNNGSIVSLTSSDNPYPQNVTQNLVAANSDANREYMNMTYNGNLTSTTRTSASYNASPFYVSTDATPTQDLPDPADGFALSMWFNRVNNSIPGYYDWTFTDPLTLHFTNGAYISFQFLHPGTGLYGSIRSLRTWYVDSSGNTMRNEYSNIESTLNGWHHVLLYVKGTGTNGAVTVSTTQADNDYKLFVDGTELVPDYSTTGATLDSSTSLTFDHIEFRKKTSSSFSDTGDIYGIDNLAFIRGSLDSSAISSIVANKNDLEAATLPQGTILTSLFKMGDGGNDVTSQDANFSIKNVIPTNDIRIVPNGTDTPFPIAQYATTDTPYKGLINSFTNVIDTASNFSISGWFKTTDTGTLFSNTGGAATTGLKVDVSGSAITASYLSSSLTTSVSGTFNDGNWHHIIMVMSSGSQLIVVDNLTSGTSNHTLVNGDLKGDNGFTLLGDGQENANNLSASSTDSSKLNATLSNWSIHSEAIGTAGISQLYSNGHVRNIKNLPSVTASAIEAWWQLADTSNPAQDLTGSSPLKYEDGASQTLVSQQVNADGATYVNGSINGNAFTMSLTKSFNFTTNEWVATADQDTALCLSFNGFEEQAEYFALWKCSQTIAGSTIDICDGDWHNVILSYRGKNDFAGDNVDPGDTVKFGPGPANSLPFNWAISYDGEPLTAIKDGSGADYIGGLNTLVTDTYSSTTYNVGFAIQDRHLKYETSNTEEEYKPHAQFSAGIHEVSGVNNNNAFQGYVDETSFHSDTWWVDQAGTSVRPALFNNEKPATIYGNTTALTNRGAGAEYPVGVPYPLLNPEKLNTSGQASDIEGTNQYINPNRYDASTNPNGGLEGWWRWGDTPGDCSITINDVRDHDNSVNSRDIDAFGIVTADRQLMTSADSIFLASSTASVGGGTTITFPQVKIEGIQQGICNLSNINSPLLQFVRVKIKGAGSMDLGEGKGQATINYTNRRRRRKK